MSIEAVCPSCSKKYQAPDRLAGKSMRCRACGGLILLPRTGMAAGGGGGGGGSTPAASSGGAESDENPFLSEDTPPGGMPAIRTPPADKSARGGARPTPPRKPAAEDDDGANLFGSADREEREDPTPFGGAAETAATPTGPVVAPIDALPPRRPWQLLPYQYHLDAWGTRLAVLLGLAFTAMWMRAPAETSEFPAWIWITRYVASLGLYIALIAPLTLLGLRRGMRMAVAPWPGNGVWRCFAAYLPAWALGVSLWNVGGGQTPALICGLVLGMVVSAGAVWLWFRLHPEEIPLVVGFSSLGFVVGWLLSLGILWSVNGAAEATASRTQAPPLYSPIGPAFKWDPKAHAPAAPPKPAPKKPAPATTPAGSTSATAPATQAAPSTPATPVPTTPTPQATPQPTPGATPTPPPGTPAAPTAPAPMMNPNGETIDPKVAPVAPAEGATEKPFVAKREAVLLGEGFEEITRPIVPGPYFGIIRKTAETQRQLEAWGDGARGSTASFTDVKNPLAVNPDGTQWARVTTFPNLAIETATFDKQVPDHIDLQLKDFNNKVPSVLGFLAKDKVLLRTDRGLATVNWADPKKPVIRIFNLPATLGAGVAPILAVSPLGDAIAIAVTDRGAQAIQIVGAERFELRRQIKVERVTTAPTGLTFSPDGLQVAAYYEEREAVVLRSFMARTGASVATLQYPAPPVPKKRAWVGSSLSWMPNGKTWLLYGDGFIDVESGNTLGTLDLENAAWAHIADDNVIEVIELNGSENRLLRITLKPNALEGR